MNISATPSCLFMIRIRGYLFWERCPRFSPENSSSIMDIPRIGSGSFGPSSGAGWYKSAADDRRKESIFASKSHCNLGCGSRMRYPGFFGQFYTKCDTNGFDSHFRAGAHTAYLCKWRKGTGVVSEIYLRKDGSGDYPAAIHQPGQCCFYYGATIRGLERDSKRIINIS